MPTENRSSNTEMVSMPREHELKIRQTPLADLLSGLKTGEVRDCSDREFAVGDTVLLREIDDSRDYTGTVLRRTITHVQKHYGLPDHLCVLSYGHPAPQLHPEPIAWMVGTAIWWTKEEAERDAAATGLPLSPPGPMAVPGDPAAWLNSATGAVTTSAVQVMDWDDEGEPVLSLYTHSDPDSMQRSWQAGYDTAWYAKNPAEKRTSVNADPGEVERLRKELAESDHAFVRASREAEQLRTKLAEQNALLREVSISPDWSLSVDLQVRISDALSASAEPSAPIELETSGLSG